MIHPLRAALVVLLLFVTLPLTAADPRVFSDWKTTEGSVLRTYPCAKELCIKIVAISSNAPGTTDFNNPDASLRHRSLCNLEIGSGFIFSGDTEAKGGRIYDPESGKTYKGSISLQGDQLKLRGYIGIAAFGRTETWSRTSGTKSCS